MRINYAIMDTPSLQAIVEQARKAAAAGIHGVFLGQVSGWDALTAVAVVANAVPDIEFGTAVVPTFPRHPVVLAGQALTAQAASGNRFTLGVGPSHPSLVEDVLGLHYDSPVEHTREYLQILRPLLGGQPVDYRGRWYSIDAEVEVPGV